MKRECTPPEALLLYNWLSDFINGKDVQYITNQQWPGKYTDVIVQCITSKRLWIGVNVQTGTVELLTSPKSELLIRQFGIRKKSKELQLCRSFSMYWQSLRLVVKETICRECGAEVDEEVVYRAVA